MSVLSDANVEAQPPADVPAKTRKRRTRRRVAKTLAWVAVALTAVMVLSEPWLLLPVITLAVALSLWD
ncbi:hypothetical protein [Asanoa sp. NPDC050611]|uniref:hypothetical protein n=1 Tax=Asanoa sp. NPDC050611 TaxID=3157098 RepID=UPI0033EC28F0